MQVDNKDGEQVLRDEYGARKGTVEKNGFGDYIVRDNYGNKIGSAEKEFLGTEYNLYNERGTKVGKTDSDLFGKGVTIRDNAGRKTARVEPVEMSTGVFIAIIVIGLLIVLSFKQIPEHLALAFSEFSVEFIAITVPLLIMIVVNIISLCRNKGFLLENDDSYFATLFFEVLFGGILYIAAIVITCIIELFIDLTFGEALLCIIIYPFILLASFLVLLLPLSLIFAGIVKGTAKQRLNKVHK